MSDRQGAAVVIIGGGVTGLSAGWWLARAGVDVLVLERGIVGWEASGRNGGGATHVYSPFGLEEQRLWPQMDELLGYPTEYQPHRIGIALSEPQLALARRWAEIGESRGFRWEPLDRRQLKELVPIVGTRRSAARICTSAATPTRSAPCRPTRGRLPTTAAGSCSTRRSPASFGVAAASPRWRRRVVHSAPTSSSWPRGRRRDSSPRCSASRCRWRPRA